MGKQYTETVRQVVRDEASFVRATFKGQLKGQELPWRRVIIRPVLLKQIRHLQFSYFDARKDITKNYRAAEAEEKLNEVLALPFSSIHLETTTNDIQIQITPEGKAIFHRKERGTHQQAPDLSHDASKALPLPAHTPDRFLQAVGIMDAQGKVLPSMQDKFTQINEFLKLLEHTGELEHMKKKPVTILDCGCGSAYLSFAVYHYVNDIKDIPARLLGIDVNEALIKKSNTNSVELGVEQACFETSAIIDYVPPEPPDIVLGLHACDTATDEALFQGIRWQARLILCAPCCHHHLHEQIQMKEPFKPVFQHGILKKRMVDILTDAFRALILRIMGYRTDVVEFVSSEHTDRNLMIRAVKRARVGEPQFLQEYSELKTFWGVTPYLETLLRKEGLWPEQ